MINHFAFLGRSSESQGVIAQDCPEDEMIGCQMTISTGTQNRTLYCLVIFCVYYSLCTVMTQVSQLVGFLLYSGEKDCMCE